MNNVLEYKGHYGDVHFSAEDNVFWGRITGVTDLITFESNDAKQLRMAFEEAVDDYIATCMILATPKREL